ncbi:MAG: iron-containing alcohol dehydrogenase [Candidatus Eisenbacteria bacterium]|nr:iron-containing alcohol dehydrogenase [Candidatus Eisenbacteria bacterium]
MKNFTYHNPVRILFGRGTIPKIAEWIPPEKRVLVIYGGGSIKKNGVYDQVASALDGRGWSAFGGIEPNPLYETCMEAVETGRREKAEFLLAVGGGSVWDAVKFIAAAIPFDAGDPWTIVSEHAPVREAIPFGGVLTLAATGSEMNSGSVISRRSTGEKIPWGSPLVFPRFSILDPETTFSLPERQTANGIVDAYVHVLEQYLTYDVNAPLQGRQAEAILHTLIEEAPKVRANPRDYDARANLMWAATQALNGLIGVGVASDWATHLIGHELTALHGLDHGRSLAVVMPAMLRLRKEAKRGKLLLYARRVWGIDGDDEDRAVNEAIERTEHFFRDVGCPTRLADYGIDPEGWAPIPARVEARWGRIGEHRDIGREEVEEILRLASGTAARGKA